MSKQDLLAVVIVSVLMSLLVAWGSNQVLYDGAKAEGDAVREPRPAAKPPELPPIVLAPPASLDLPGRYRLITYGHRELILLDTATGRAWFRTTSGDGQWYKILRPK